MNKLNKIILVLAIVIVLLVVIILYVFFSNQQKSSLNVDSDPTASETSVGINFDSNSELIIIDESLVRAKAKNIVDSVWKAPYTNFIEEDTLVLPESGVSFSNVSVDSELTLAAMTAMAYTQNPYLGDSNEGAIQIQPDGITANMKLYKQEYSDLQFFGYSDDISRYVIKGYCNGDYFESEVNIMDFLSR